MLTFVLRRLGSAIPTLFIIVTLSFFLMRLAPGGPFNLERPLPPQIMENLNRTYGFDQPMWRQYLIYMGNVVQGDLGPSYIYRDRSVANLLGEGLGYSIKLGGLALLVALVGGVLAGLLAALRQNRPLDFLIMSGATAGVTIPNFVIGPVLVLIFSITLSWTRAGGWGTGSFRDLVLPVIALALPQLAVFARLTRGAMIEAMSADHIRTARAYGLPARSVVGTHAMRGAMLPIVSYLAPCAAGLLTGSAVVETIFAIPGVGRYFVHGALARDYTVVMGTVVLVAVFVIVFNLIVDVIYGLLDPRVRHD
ncbi:ABC transporter permease subunit [Neomegalonema sp.]|uniref:ABC transporter permease subunit n=1 Tax=Neomegalonema sp. TaxID=2039713 RepID=UPI002633E579|nr:ABC transporter permease subunit [Neomegalonema sp.]MDD2867577.1 ABC transporter permease subunit [Neomegalonema sp.]